MTTGGSIEGSNSPISDSSNATAASYSKRMSTNNCLSTGERNPVPIFMIVRHSGVSLDPRGTLFPVVDANVEADDGGKLLELTPLGSGTFAGSTFRPFRLYIVLTNALHCFRLNTILYLPLFPSGSNCKSSKVSFRT